MLHINRVTLLGHAGRDPEIRTLRSGDRTASFSLATTEKWKDRDGRPAQATEWHRVAVYGGTVEAVERLVSKGAAVLVEGRADACATTPTSEGKDRRRSPRSSSPAHRAWSTCVSPKPPAEAGAACADAEPEGAGESAAGEADA